MGKVKSKKVKAIQKEYLWYKKKVDEMEEVEGLPPSKSSFANSPSTSSSPMSSTSSAADW